jgi:metal-responsive CopG/Arc/MetJ family transcriptional regulator
MGRVNVFLKDELLDEINREAETEHTNRSSLIQTALEEFLKSKRTKRAEEEKRKKMQDASRKMDALAKKLGDWDPQTTIRRFRYTNLKGDE